MAYLVGCDVGTGAAKSVVIDGEARVVASHAIEYPLSTPRPGWAEQDADDLWRAAAATMRGALERAGVSPAEVAGVGVSAHSPGVVLVDGMGRALRPAIIWLDRRPTEQCRWVREHANLDRIVAVTGVTVVDESFALAKLMWARDNEPDLYRRAAKALNPKDYIVMRLCGAVCTDPSNAGLDGLAYDLAAGDWDTEVVRDLGLDRDKLPDVRLWHEVAGRVTAQAAALCGLAEGTPVVVGTMDGAAAWLSMGLSEPGDSVLTLGSSATWSTVHRERLPAPGLLLLDNIANPGTYATVGATACSGAVLRWFRDEFAAAEREQAAVEGKSAYDLLTAQAARIAPGSDGLLALPYFMGERMPMWDHAARGVLFGLSLRHTRAHVIRALMEGVAFSIHDIIETARAAGVATPAAITLVEGGANSPLWRQIISDVCGVETVFVQGSQGAPFADALIAGVGVGVFANYRLARRGLTQGDRTRPRPEAQSVYARLFEVYQGLYPSLRPHFAALSDFCASLSC